MCRVTVTSHNPEGIYEKFVQYSPHGSQIGTAFGGPHLFERCDAAYSLPSAEQVRITAMDCAVRVG